MEAFTEVSSTESFMEAFMEVMEAFAAVMEAFMEVTSTKAFMEAFTEDIPRKLSWKRLRK